jgi:F0F1-type ATP synthase membrane subunit a
MYRDTGLKIRTLHVRYIRFPTSLESHGSDAMVSSFIRCQLYVLFVWWCCQQLNLNGSGLESSQIYVCTFLLTSTKDNILNSSEPTSCCGSPLILMTAVSLGVPESALFTSPPQVYSMFSWRRQYKFRWLLWVTVLVASIVCLLISITSRGLHKYRSSFTLQNFNLSYFG